MQLARAGPSRLGILVNSNLPQPTSSDCEPLSPEILTATRQMDVTIILQIRKYYRGN